MIKNKYIVILIYTLIIITIISSIFIVPIYYKDNVRIFNLLVWISIFHISIIINAPKIRTVSIIEKIKTIQIIIIAYYIIYFIVGFWFGYSKSPFSHSIIAILNNFLFIYIIQLFQEYVRTKLLGVTNNFLIISIITLIFVIVKINFVNISSNFVSIESTFKYFTSIVFVEIITSILLTYLSISGGLLLNLSYTGIIVLGRILLPIFPNIDWFFDIILKAVLIFLIYLSVENENIFSNKIKEKREVSRTTILKELPGIFIFIILIQFIIGFFPIKPIAIKSNSMYPTFSRGSLVICKNIDKDDVNEVKIGDIIVYNLEGNRIVHRVVNIYINEYFVKTYVTKGDFNLSPDYKGVLEEQITGVIVFTIPFLGYPSIWISENIFNIMQNS